jgi:hypothetical protein
MIAAVSCLPRVRCRVFGGVLEKPGRRLDGRLGRLQDRVLSERPPGTGATEVAPAATIVAVGLGL